MRRVPKIRVFEVLCLKRHVILSASSILRLRCGIWSVVGALHKLLPNLTEIAEEEAVKIVREVHLVMSLKYSGCLRLIGCSQKIAENGCLHGWCCELPELMVHALHISSAYVSTVRLVAVGREVRSQ